MSFVSDINNATVHLSVHPTVHLNTLLTKDS